MVRGRAGRAGWRAVPAGPARPAARPGTVAFRLAAEAYPDAYALLDARFWCLPTDPAAEHPDATAVGDEAALAAVLRAQVREHADAFLAQHPSRGRLPRRALLGAFTDGMDTGLWLGGDPTPERLLPDAALALPAGPSPLPASTLHVLVDGRGRRHVDRRTLSCCYYFTINPAAGPCGTCPRIPADRTAAPLTDLPDEPAGSYYVRESAPSPPRVGTFACARMSVLPDECANSA